MRPYRRHATGTFIRMATLRLFASAREAAGTSRDTIDGDTVGAVLDGACVRYGEAFAAVLEKSRVWRNGEPVTRDDPVSDADEVAVLPPVWGGKLARRPSPPPSCRNGSCRRT